MALVVIPADLGQGGANLSEGSPKLVEILKGMNDAIVALQAIPVTSPTSKQLKVFFGHGRASAGSISLDNSIFGGGTVAAAEVGDKVLAVLEWDASGGFVNAINPGNGGSGNYENTITVHGHIQQTSAGNHAADNNMYILQTP